MNKSQRGNKRRSREEWLLHVEQWRTSGLPQSEYCNRNNLNPCSFSAWKVKFDEDAADFAFVEINKTSLMDTYNSGNNIELTLGKISLCFSETIDPARLRDIVMALSEV